MCILCVASRWSRRIVTMLPWLVIPLIILWALSQLLPPGFRFEVTSPRLACVAVLLVSLAWYEIAMPRLSAWRAKRRALLRERRRIEAQEVAKWRKEATRRCRNCLTPYKDQTPGGGKFMCTYCGHVSKRPVLDVPGGVSVAGMAGNPFSATGATSGLISGLGIIPSRSSKLWSGRGLPDRSTWGGGRGWIGSMSWLADGGSGWGVNASWFGSPWSGGSLYLGTLGTGWGGLGAFVGDTMFGGERCIAGESYSGVFFVVLRIFSLLLSLLGWISRKLCRAGFPGDDGLNRGHRSCQRRGEDASPSPATRGEKARRKAEEKRLARLEKEQLEAEEKKQREEVARLVEERRRQRDEKLEAEKETEREAAAEREREIRREREVERRRQEKAREREKLQVKTKEQEMEDMKKKKGKEIEKRNDTEKKDELKIGGSDSGKVPKPSKAGLVDMKGTEIKGASNVSSKGKYTGSGKTGFFSQSKNVAASINNATSFWGRTLSTGSSSAGKSSKTVASGGGSSLSSSRLSDGSSGKSTDVSRSAWNRIPWTNVWGKAIGRVPEDASREKKESENNLEGAKDLADGSLVADLADGSLVAVSAVGGDVSAGAQQQPIAPPSSSADSWNNLFLSPSCFPPIELPMESGMCQGSSSINETLHPPITSLSLPSDQSFFGSSSPVGLPLSESYTSFPISEAAIISSLPPAVSGSLNLIDFSPMNMQDPLSLLGPVSDSLMSSQSNDFQTGLYSSVNSTPLSPLTPFRAVDHVSSAAISPIDIPGLVETGKDELPSILEPWTVPPLPLDSINSQGLWTLWGEPQVNPLNASSWCNSLKQSGEGSQSFSTNYLQPSFEPEPQLPSSLFLSDHKQEIIDMAHGESIAPDNFPGLSNFWLNTSALEPMMHAWEDSSVHHKVPPDFIDCITHSLMHDPVITADGHSYERHAIEAWLKSHDTSPKTGEVLPPPPGGIGIGVDKTLRPNHILRGQIIEYRERLARRLGSQDSIHSNGWTPAAGAMSSTSWSSQSSSSMRPQFRGFYPTPGTESLWSYNA